MSGPRRCGETEGRDKKRNIRREVLIEGIEIVQAR